MTEDDQPAADCGESVQDDPAQATACVLAVLDMCGLMARNPATVVRAGGGG